MSDTNKNEIIKTENQSFLKNSVPLSEKRDINANPFKNIYHYFFDNSSRKTYTLLTMTFVFISVLSVFAIYPTINSITQIVKKIEEYKDIQLQQKEKISNLIKLQRLAENSINNNGLSEYINYFDKTYMPDNVVDENIYRDIATKAKTANLDIANIKTLTVVDVINVNNIKAATYQVSLTALKREDIDTFVNILRKAKNFYTIQKMSINNSIDASGNIDLLNGKVSSTITFVTYYYV